LMYAKAHDSMSGVAMAGLGMIPGSKYTKELTKEAIEALQGHVYTAGLGFPKQKELKTSFPKNIAAAAHEMGLDAEQIANLKNNMSEGSIKAFDNHYAKMAKGVEPVPGPLGQSYQDLSPGQAQNFDKSMGEALFGKQPSPDLHKEIEELLA